MCFCHYAIGSVFAIIGLGGCGRTSGCSLKEDQFLYLFYADRLLLPLYWADTVNGWDQSDLQTKCDIIQIHFFCTEVRFRDSQLGGSNYFLFVRYWRFSAYTKHPISDFVCHSFWFCAVLSREIVGCWKLILIQVCYRWGCKKIGNSTGKHSLLDLVDCPTFKIII